MDYKFVKNAKVSQKGQVTIPSEIRKILEVENGDYITFGVNKDGELIINNRANIVVCGEIIE